jgi:hypothetical protein
MASNCMGADYPQPARRAPPVDSTHWLPATWHILSAGWIRFLVPVPLCHKIFGICTLLILDPVYVLLLGVIMVGSSIKSWQI